MHTGEIAQDREGKQFYLAVDAHRAFIDYGMHNGQYVLLHSEVPPDLRGQGIGRILVEKTFAAIKAQGKTAVAKCGFVRHVARESGQWDDVVQY